MRDAIREDEVTERISYRRPTGGTHVDVVRTSHVRARADEPTLRVATVATAPSLRSVDASIDRLAVTASRARSACESTRSAAMCLGVSARDAGRQSRERASSGTRIPTIPGMQAPDFGDDKP